jgi:hypothetical protein
MMTMIWTTHNLVSLPVLSDGSRARVVRITTENPVDRDFRELSKKQKGYNRIWTNDLSSCDRLLYHWAMHPSWWYYQTGFSTKQPKDKTKRKLGTSCWLFSLLCLLLITSHQIDLTDPIDWSIWTDRFDHRFGLSTTVKGGWVSYFQVGWLKFTDENCHWVSVNWRQRWTIFQEKRM